MKTPATITALLLASALGLQAQSYTNPSTQPTTSSSTGTQAGSQEKASPTASQSQSSTNQPASTSSSSTSSASPSSSTTPSASASTSSSDDLTYRSNQPKEVQQNSQASTDNKNNGSTQQNSSTSQTNVAQTGSQTSSQTDVAVTAETETQVRTVVQQIDAQGPVVVERISTEFADATCTQENARALVEALHNGTSVTLRNEDGKTATFTPTAHLGYGDAYIALAVAVQTLRDAGITGCASPEQWQAVLLGGELRGPSVRTTSVTTERFPGVLVLHEQGGWTKVAQTTHVQLNQVVSQANSSLQINNSNSSTSAQANNSSVNSSTNNQQNLSPTGFSREHDARANDKSKDDDKSKDQDHDKDKNKDSKRSNYDQDHKIGQQNSPDTENPPKSETPPKY